MPKVTREVKSHKERLGTRSERVLLLGHTQHPISDCSVWKLDLSRSGRETKMPEWKPLQIQGRAVSDWRLKEGNGEEFYLKETGDRTDIAAGLKDV